MTPDSANEKMKRAYRVYLKEAKKLDSKTIDIAMAAIEDIELFNKRKDFKSFNRKLYIAYKKALSERVSGRTKRILSKATQYGRLRATMDFLHWLADKPGYRSKIDHADVQYLSSSLKDARRASAAGDRLVPTLEQARHVVLKMPANTDIEHRDRAIMAFLLLTGVRISALVSLKIKHVNLHEKRVFQDGSEVDTKAAKTGRIP
jgi:integrase/recombinase XerD